MNDVMIKVSHLSKRYKLGEIGGTTLKEELQRAKAKLHHQEDPTKKIGVKNYNKGEIFTALDDINLEIKKGERIGIIGHNGAGKSTLLKLLCRVTAPTSGEIGLNGRITSMLEVGTGFHYELTGRENVYLNGAILGMSKAEIDKKIDDIIAFSECGQFIDTPVKRYSSGMYVKLAFSVAAHLESEIMIMDEVLAVGDMAFQKKCLDKMNAVSKNEGRTILYVSHNMNTIRQLCERCIVLDHGKIIFDGGVEEAIGLYLKVANEQDNWRSYLDYKRTYNLPKDSIFVRKASFVGKENNTFKHGEKMRLNFEWDNLGDVSNLGLRVEIRTSLGEPVMAYVFENTYQGEKGKRVSADYECDLSMLSPGKYSGFYTFFFKNEFGTCVDADNVPAINFVIEQYSIQGMANWRSSVWGHVVIADGKYVVNKEE